MYSINSYVIREAIAAEYRLQHPEFKPAMIEFDDGMGYGLLSEIIVPAILNQQSYADRLRLVAKGRHFTIERYNNEQPRYKQFAPEGYIARRQRRKLRKAGIETN